MDGRYLSAGWTGGGLVMIIDNNSIATTEDWTQKIENGCVWLWSGFGAPMCRKSGSICGFSARNPRACPIGKSLKDSYLEKKRYA